MRQWLLAVLAAAAGPAAQEKDFQALFHDDGRVTGVLVRDWADVSEPAPEGAVWEVKEGVLYGSTPRGTWLITEQEYADFVLEYEFKLGARGNSGLGLRFPLDGDPAYDGLEIQMVDPRYYGDQAVGPEQLTGAVYPAVPGNPAMYKPEDWNAMRVELQGPRLKVQLNGEVVQDIDLDQQTRTLERGTPLKDRPRRGHIGFQELSRGGSQAMFRNLRIKEF